MHYNNKTILKPITHPDVEAALKRLTIKKKDIYACLIYYSKAFDIMKYEPLIEMI